MHSIEHLWVLCNIFNVIATCYVQMFPQQLVRWISIPPVLCVQNGFGPISLKLQSLAYISIHSSLISRLSHVMIFDAIAWMIVLRQYPLLFSTILIFMLIQLLSFKDTKFFIFASLFWIGCYFLGTFFFTLLDANDLLFYSKVVLLTTPILREFGHLTVPTPPWVLVNPSSKFEWTPTSEILKANATELEASIFLFGTSFVFEFNAGLPLRLPSVFCYTELYLPLVSLFMKDVEQHSRELHKEANEIVLRGWQGSAVTGSVFKHNPIVEASKLKKLELWNYHEDPLLEQIDLDGVIDEVQQWTAGEFQSWVLKRHHGNETLEVGENPSCGYSCVKQVFTQPNTDLESVADLMTTKLLSTLDQWSSTFQGGELLKQIGPDTWVFHVRHDCSPFPSRDFVYVVHQKKISDHQTVVLNASIQWKGVPVFKNCIRGKIFPSITRITQLDNNTVNLERFSTAIPRGYIPGLLYQVAFFPAVVEVFDKDAAKLKDLLTRTSPRSI